MLSQLGKLNQEEYPQFAICFVKVHWSYTIYMEVFMKVKVLAPYKDLYDKLSFLNQFIFGGVSCILG